MDITKRNGSTAPFDREKIATAIKKSFISTGRAIVDDEINDVAIAVEQIIINQSRQTKQLNVFKTRWKKA